jgi:hypothetical protein
MNWTVRKPIGPFTAASFARKLIGSQSLTGSNDIWEFSFFVLPRCDDRYRYRACFQFVAPSMSYQLNEPVMALDTLWAVRLNFI